MAKFKPNKTIIAIDPDGTPVTGIILNNSNDICWMFTEDYERINSELGQIRSWYVNTNGQTLTKYVRLKRLGNNFMVARLVLGHEPRTSVRYHDRNPLNLRRTNLYVEFGRGGCASKTKRHPLRSPLKIPQGARSGDASHV